MILSRALKNSAQVQLRPPLSIVFLDGDWMAHARSRRSRAVLAEFAAVDQPAWTLSATRSPFPPGSPARTKLASRSGPSRTGLTLWLAAVPSRTKFPSRTLLTEIVTNDDGMTSSATREMDLSRLCRRFRRCDAANDAAFGRPGHPGSEVGPDRLELFAAERQHER